MYFFYQGCSGEHPERHVGPPLFIPCDARRKPQYTGRKSHGSMGLNIMYIQFFSCITNKISKNKPYNDL